MFWYFWYVTLSIIALFPTYVLYVRYLLKRTVWCRSQTCLVNKTVIITGANTGIGYEAALDFAKRGARVILACRDKSRAEAARLKIIKETDNKNIVIKILDLASFRSVRAFAKEIYATEKRLDILVNNAAVAGLKEWTEDGHPLTMQVNYFSSFLLTHLLLGLLKKTAPSRIINVASIAARQANFNISQIDEIDLMGLRDYDNSKLCNICFTIELAKKLEGSGVTTYSLHPGVIETEIFRNLKGGILVLMKNLKFFKNSEEGAQTTIYTAVAKGIEKYNGEHFDNCQSVEPYKSVLCSQLREQIWDKTEEIVQLRPEERIH